MTNKERYWYSVVNHKTMVWNYDNVELFRVRYYRTCEAHKRHYRNTSLLYKYCKDIMKQNLVKAGRLFCMFGNLGILDIVDLIEAKNYIHQVDPTIFTHNAFPITYKHYMIDILKLLGEDS